MRKLIIQWDTKTLIKFILQTSLHSKNCVTTKPLILSKVWFWIIFNFCPKIISSFNSQFKARGNIQHHKPLLVTPPPILSIWSSLLSLTSPCTVEPIYETFQPFSYLSPIFLFSFFFIHFFIDFIHFFVDYYCYRSLGENYRSGLSLSPIVKTPRTRL